MATNEKQSANGVAKSLKTALFVVLVASVVAALVWLSLHPKHVPVLPVDADHRDVADWTTCLTCHGPDGPNPLKQGHPVHQDQCFLCHQPPDGEKR